MYKEQLEKEIKVHKMLLESKEISQYEKDMHYDNLQDVTAELRGFKLGKAQANAEIERLSNILGHYEDELVKTKEKALKEFKEKLKEKNKIISPFAELDEKRWRELLNEFEIVINKTAQEILTK